MTRNDIVELIVEDLEISKRDVNDVVLLFLKEIKKSYMKKKLYF